MRFEIFINGEEKCTAGIDGYGILTTTLNRIKRNPKSTDTDKLEYSTPEEFLREKVEIEVGGLDSNKENPDGTDFFHYFREQLNEGDELLIRILPPGEFDEPKRETNKFNT